MNDSPFWKALWRWGIPGITALALAWIVLNALFNPAIQFLADGPGNWIAYPIPPQLRACPAIKLSGTFRRAFVLTEKPALAEFSWRSMTNGLLHVNGALVPLPQSASGSWKTARAVDLASYLRPGTNLLVFTAINAGGPPAVSARLRCGNLSIQTDETWETSISGSIWQPAQFAWRVPVPKKGNALDDMGTTIGALQRDYLWLGVIAMIALCAAIFFSLFINRCPAATAAKITLGVVGALWLLLFAHNFQSLPADAGFDAQAHLAYVKYIQDYHMLPAAYEGWEMFQAPLYYVVSAILLTILHCQITDYSGLLALRFFSLAIGIATVIFIYAGLRALFPGDWKKQLAGTIFAAFVPAEIYLLHYTTNETLSAMFATAALAMTLRILRTEENSWKWRGGLGVVLGLALMSKASSALIVPAILGVLGIKLLLLRERALKIWLMQLGLPAALCLVVGGWHYLKLWHEYGSPFTGNWNPKIGPPWWQYKGLQTPAYYLTFGTSFVRPICSGLRSFWDGFYSTLWGDALLGGRIDIWSPAPWNFDLMAIGYIFALAPTLFVLTGTLRMIAQCIRTKDLPMLLLLAVGWLYAFAILGMSFKVPSYAQTKAFYGLPALLPFCAFGALGFEYWTARAKIISAAAVLLAAIWLTNVYATFWIRPDSIQTKLACAIAASYLNEDASHEFAEIQKRHPGDSQSAVWLALTESGANPKLAIERLQAALKISPSDGPMENQMAECLVQAGDFGRALAHAQRAVKLSPGDVNYYETLCGIYLRRGDFPEALNVARAALGVDPTSLEMHLYLGEALMSTGQYPEADWHFQTVADYEPDSPDAHYLLGHCLTHQPGRFEEGIAHLTEAVNLSPTNSAWRAELQKASQSH